MKKQVLCLAGLLVAACANPPEEHALPAATPLVASPAAESCAPPSDFGGYIFWLEPPAVLPGASMVLTPWFTSRPGMIVPVAASCLQDVAITGPATLGPDGRTVLIDADAASGAAIQVQARVGEASLSGRMLVYLEEALPLVGRWAQPEAACAAVGAEPVRELIFHPDGTFSLTWTPFEIYKDYWGTYTFEDGRLQLSPEGGNHMPADAAYAGTAELAGGSLRLAPGLFGSPRQGIACTEPFGR
ncbi:hypothetical protein [Hyphomonas sp.]|uniref:hypothetical protein n=1 Tax=Hyphomonas sp. TaxID=87 RepID=UPI00391952EE